MSLAPADAARSDWITQIIPEINASASGSGLRLRARYAPEIAYYARTRNDPELFHRGRVDGTAELVDETLFTEVGASVDQYNISLLGPLTNNNANTTNNVDTVTTAFVSPFYRHVVGQGASAEARYTSSIWKSDKQPELDNSSSRVDFSLVNGPASTRNSWGFDYYGEQLRYDDTSQPRVTSHVGAARGALQLVPTLSLLGRAGYEYYRFDDFRPKSNGSEWAGGIGWTPSPRSSLTAFVGRRFFGNTYELDLRHRARRVAFSAGYEQQIATTRAQFFAPATGNTAAYFDQLFARTISDPVERQGAVDSLMREYGIPTSLNSPVTYSGTQLFLNRRWQATVSVLGANNVVIGNAFRLHRNAVQGDILLPGTAIPENNTVQTGGSLSWSWNATARSTWNQLVAATFIDFPDAGRQDKVMDYSLSLSHRLQTKTLVDFRYRWRKNDSSISALDYRENSVMASIRMEF